MAARAYFTPATFRFFRALARNNNRAWFDAHKDDYERFVRAPFIDFIGDIAAPLARISPHFRADPRKSGGSLFRYIRDTRFSHNKMPYKPWQGARFFHQRRRECQTPGFYLHIEPNRCYAGGGLWSPDADALRRIREFLVDNPAAWKRATRSKAFTDHVDFGGESLQRYPRGFDPDHELIDDLKRKDFVAGSDFDEALACSDELLSRTLATFKRVAPMVDYLCAALDLEF